MKLNDIVSKLEQRFYTTPAFIAAIGVFIVTIFALFVPPYIGMADNGDYFRILYSNGLYFHDPDYINQYLGYFVKQYGILQYYNENGATIFSSQSIFIKLATVLNEWFYSSEVFDIRFQAGLYLVLYSIGIYLLVEALTWKLDLKRGYIISLLTILIYADTAYTAYFSSFYSESVVFIALIYLVAAVLLLYRSRYNDYVMIIVFTLASLLLTTSKQQNAPVGVIIAVAGLLLLLVKKSKPYKGLTAFCLLVIMLAGIGSYALISDEFKNINKYHAMNRGIMLNSHDPESSLENFDIDRQYSVLSGDIYYLPFTTVDVNSNILIENFYDKYGYVSILLYYMTHPDQAIEMLNLAAKNGFAIRPAAMGNFEASAGRAFGEQTTFFSMYSGFKELIAPKNFGFIIIWIIVVVGLFIPSFFTALKERDRKGMITLPFMITLIIIGLSAIVVSIVGAGDADLAKHQFLFTACFDVITFVTISGIIARKLW